MRALFGVPADQYQIGSDAAGLEARVEAHFTRQFEGGEAYAQALISEKPNDIHTVNAAKMGVDREVAKELKYATTYGAQVKKIAQMLGVSLEEAEKIFKDFWAASLPLEILKEHVATYWKTKGHKVFIRGIDGRKLMTRSEHSLLNVLFQSTGAIVMKRQMVMYMRKLKDRNMYSNPFRESEILASQMMHYHK
jgi:DNA polymerase I-like protein with 3'-5' exonuclease and polymerase domains